MQTIYQEYRDSYPHQTMTNTRQKNSQVMGIVLIGGFKARFG
jgi:hypothetical protein